MRLAVIGLAVVLGMGAVLLHRAIAPTIAEDAQGWRAQRLLFLKAAYDRVQADLEREPDKAAAASMRRQQAAILEDIATVANDLPDDGVPEGIKPLLPVPEPPNTEQLAELIETVQADKPIELRSGLGAARLPAPDLDGLDADPDLRAPIYPRAPRRKPPRDKPGDEPAPP